MLSIYEEKSMHFPNHNWKEFRARYERLIENSDKAYKALVKLEAPYLENLHSIANQIEVYRKRLEEIDQLIARGCSVIFINVTKQLIDQGVIER